ncbi:MAG: glycosyltransferase family 4 protein [Actinomycetota bacterium]
MYQYSVTMLDALRELAVDTSDEWIVLLDDAAFGGSAVDQEGRWIVADLEPPTPQGRARKAVKAVIPEGTPRDIVRRVMRLVKRAKETGSGSLDTIHHRPDLRAWFDHLDVELVLYPTPNPLSFEVGVPYVMAVHDLQHRLQPEFAEASQGGQWEMREYVFRNAARTATLLLADSETGREDLVECYGEFGLTEERVKVLPFLPAPYLSPSVSRSHASEIRRKYRLPERFFFYPAQFWPHKNHARIIEALALVESRHGVRASVVFCGTRSGRLRRQTFKEVMTLARDRGMTGRVHYLGYVGDDEMSVLYAEAVALVMPTFFGPTNIPVVEAWYLGCPVLTSDLRGIREHSGDAALLVDPRSVEDIAAGLHRLWTDETLRAGLSAAGRARLRHYTPSDYRERLTEILDEAKARVGA